MSVSIITFADLGKRKNLKTIGIMPVIEAFSKRGLLDSIACRTNVEFSFKKTTSVIPLWLRVMIRLLELVTFKLLKSRLIEEWLLDQRVYKKIDHSPVVIFHPEYFFQKSLVEVKKRGSIAIGIATMGHLAMNARLEDEEFGKLGIASKKSHHMYRTLMHNHLNDFDYIIALSEFVKISYREAGFPEERIFVAETDLDALPAVASVKYDTTFRVVYVANTGVLKGLHYLLDAWKMLTVPDKELVIIGIFRDMPDELQARYDKAIKEDPTIKYVGEIDRASVLEYYRKASVSVLPSLSEGNPRVVLEAMAMGIPVITTTYAPSLVTDGTSGFIVPIRDARAIAEKLEFLHQNPEIANRMGDVARRAIAHKKPFGEAVYEIYETIKQNHNL